MSTRNQPVTEPRSGSEGKVRPAAVQQRLERLEGLLGASVALKEAFLAQAQADPACLPPGREWTRWCLTLAAAAGERLPER